MRKKDEFNYVSIDILENGKCAQKSWLIDCIFSKYSHLAKFIFEDELEHYENYLYEKESQEN